MLSDLPGSMDGSQSCHSLSPQCQEEEDGVGTKLSGIEADAEVVAASLVLWKARGASQYSLTPFAELASAGAPQVAAMLWNHDALDTSCQTSYAMVP